MVKKVIDSRIHTLVKNGVQNKHRSFFVIVGDKGKDQVVNLHWLLSQAQVTARPSVLWCYKKDLGFTSHRKKREAKIKREIKKGIREANQEDPFELFIAVTNIRYTYYKETDKILGNTFGMCVLQDFEALTPNYLARTIETVEGGGIVVLLLKTMSSLKQLYTMTMDAHSRYRTEAHSDVVARFNERFILSLGSCENCLVVDDELNVLPVSMGKNVKPLPPKSGDDVLTPSQIELRDLKKSLEDTQPVGALINTSRTLDQAKALLTFIEAISEKTLRNTVTLTAARGRGKSAALGIAIAAAVAYGYSNIFVTSPSPENLKTLFEFIFKGFDALKYEEHLDYDIIQSTNPAFNKAIVRVNIFRQHRQTIQYIQPQDAHVLGQAELVVIDEAAAIPLPLVKALMGPYLVFMASTINGYEGTGRSLSLKLIKELREQSQGFIGKADGAPTEGDGQVVGRDMKTKSEGVNGSIVGGRSLREIKLEEPIRYAPQDPVEKWLTKLLCLDATVVNRNIQGVPHPSDCELFYVNRDTLFSYHPVSEAFLQRMMALYVASHYKNSPNDLQLLSDAPAHHLFVLLPPIKEGDTSLPDPLCVVQVCLEGQISKASVMNSLSRGKRESGDLIPWLISQQFQDEDFATLSGARVVRIATHPDYMKMGYGSRALELLTAYYQGQFTSLSEGDVEQNYSVQRLDPTEMANADLHTDEIKIRDPRKMPPLLLKLSEKRPELLHYLGVSYGLTQSLHKFWKRAGFLPLYIRQTTNELTGEHTCVMLRTLPFTHSATETSEEWLSAFAHDFQRRFNNLLSFEFRSFSSILALSILEALNAGKGKADKIASNLTREELNRHFTSYDLKRLESYANNMLDYHVIVDLLPTIAILYFGNRIPQVRLNGAQSSVLLAIGLQRKTIDDIAKELKLPASTILAYFIKIIKKFTSYFKEVQTRELERDMQQTTRARPKIEAHVNGKRSVTDEEAWDPLKENLEDDLDEAGKEAMKALREKQQELISGLDLDKYAIAADDADWDAAEEQIKAIAQGKKPGVSSVVSVKNDQSSKKRKKLVETAAEIASKEAKRAFAGKHKMSKKTRRS
ncbi:RNA cytidine acetyltransferase [Bifiguratus adelaidae]|uniref:RNA cytidine acetyltransferase n=1 Tax=Bifiguratus adelaidae TaxID=1938954 RepID=A0A261Y1F6_9FUNG|nr:RNA cytidine acetyltransferase [Bifiguratus adelaidae]